MSFKLDVALDRSSTFLNLEEFGEEHTVDGYTVPCVLDTVTRAGRDLSIGLPGETYTLFVRVEDVPGRTPPGAVMVVDGISYVVEAWAEDMGMAEVTLVRAE